jgi:pimeloyl-ACP methyl ester carboxylesterase
MPIGKMDLPLIDIGMSEPLVCVPILEHLEFVYARQIRSLSQQRRVILYRRREARTAAYGLRERVEELRTVLDGLELARSDLLGHGDAAMVLLEFAARHPERCRSLTIIAQGADYRIAPHPWIWLLHELFTRLPIEHLLPAWFLRRLVINYITAHNQSNNTFPELPRSLIEAQFRKIQQWPAVYKFSVLPIIHSFDMRKRINTLKMPVLLINRADDVLSPESKTCWLAQHLPDCAGYHVIAGRERFFMYSQAEAITPIIAAFLQEVASRQDPVQQIQL